MWKKRKDRVSISQSMYVRYSGTLDALGHEKSVSSSHRFKNTHNIHEKRKKKKEKKKKEKSSFIAEVTVLTNTAIVCVWYLVDGKSRLVYVMILLVTQSVNCMYTCTLYV